VALAAVRLAALLRPADQALLLALLVAITASLFGGIGDPARFGSGREHARPPSSRFIVLVAGAS
jgi:hypothetical protein